MTQRGSAPIFLIVIVLAVVAAVAFGFSKFQGANNGPGGQPGWGQRPGGAQDFGGPPQGTKKERWNGPIPTPPQNKITYYKGALANSEGDRISFKGYDVLGFVTRPTSPNDSAETLKKVFDEDMDRARDWAKRDGVPEIVISEHGNRGDTENIQMDSAENFGVILEEGSKKLRRPDS